MADDWSDTESAPDQSYRAELIGADGRVAATVIFHAASDADALDQVRGITSTNAVRLWDGSRMVVSVPKRCH